MKETASFPVIHNMSDKRMEATVAGILPQGRRCPSLDVAAAEPCCQICF